MKQCAGCHVEISSDQLVMKAKDHVYHLHCFRCACCQKVLSTGEYFGMRDEQLFCKTHYEEPPALPPPPAAPAVAAVDVMCTPCDFMDFHSSPAMGHHHHHHHGMDMLPGGLPPPMTSASRLNTAGRAPPFYNGVGTTKKGRPRGRKNQQSQQNELALMCKCLLSLRMYESTLERLRPNAFTLNLCYYRPVTSAAGPEARMWL